MSEDFLSNRKTMIALLRCNGWSEEDAEGFRDLLEGDIEDAKQEAVQNALDQVPGNGETQ